MELSITLLNLGYAIVGALLTLVFMVIGYMIFDKMTPFNTSKQISIRGKVVREAEELKTPYTPYAYGIEFSQIRPAEELKLNQFIENIQAANDSSSGAVQLESLEVI